MSQFHICKTCCWNCK